MNRDYTNEIIAAIAAVALLAFAVTFSILLAVVDSESRAESGTTVAVVPSEPGAGVETNVDSVVEPTSTRTPRPTHTDEPSATRTLRPTNTDAPTATDEPTATRTLRPTNTDAPTATDEPTATRTLRPTNTDAPTATDESTATFTAEPTNTPIPAENQTLGIIVTPTPCVGRTDWAIYVVHPMDTLQGIAEVAGTTADALLAGNCLLDAEAFETGLELRVPRLPEWMPIGCLSFAVIIESPVPGEQITADFEVVGTVNVEDQSFYRLEIRPDNTAVYNTLARSRDAVVAGVLGEVVRDDYDDGVYWLRVVAVDKQANIPSDGICTIPVRFE